VRATAKVIRRSRTLVVHEIEMTLVETGELLCISRVTNLYRPHR
jgi:acyl-coenzyme A thioesterase PaaI-like protein